MIKYLIVALCALIFGAYFYGLNIANAKCQMRYINKNSQIQNQLIKNERIIHDTVYKTGVVDIRNIMRNKYTIAD